MSFRRGDVVLVPFPFVERKAYKKRPALVVSGAEYNDSCPDLIVAQITGRLDAPHRPGDHLVKSWREAGLHEEEVHEEPRSASVAVDKRVDADEPEMGVCCNGELIAVGVVKP